MDRNDLIKIGVVLVALSFITEYLSISSRLNLPNSGSTLNETNQTEQSIYAVGMTGATLSSYSDYLIISKSGIDVSGNSSLMDLSSIVGVAYLNSQNNGLTLLLKPGANVTKITKEVNAKFPDLNVTAQAFFSLPSSIELNTSTGTVNVSTEKKVTMAMNPILEIGENVTLMLSGVTLREQFVGQPVIKIIPEEVLTTLNAQVSELTNDYFARAVIDWKRRNLNVTLLEGEISKKMIVIASEYSLNSSVIVENLSNNESNAIKNLSYVAGVRGSEIVLKDDFLDEEKASLEIGGITGNKSMIFPDSVFAVAIRTENMSVEFLNETIKPKSIDVFRKGILRLTDDVTIAGVRQYFETSRDVDALLELNSTVGNGVIAIARVTKVGSRILDVELIRMLQ
jgi:hypothetical protein